MDFTCTQCHCKFQIEQKNPFPLPECPGCGGCYTSPGHSKIQTRQTAYNENLPHHLQDVFGSKPQKTIEFFDQEGIN